MDSKTTICIYMCNVCSYKYKTATGAKNCIHPYSIKSSL